MQRTRRNPGRRRQASTGPSGPIDPPRADDSDEAIVSCEAARIGAIGHGVHGAVVADMPWGQGSKWRDSTEA